MIRRLAIIGVGLIGGSLARALRRAGACGEIVGCGRDADHLRRAVELGVIDRYETDPAGAVAGADVVVLAVPLGAMQAVLRSVVDALEDDAVITDVGSAKVCVEEAASAVFGSVPPRFIPGHPIAGNERSGVEASMVDLFEGRRVILTPNTGSDSAAVGRIRKMWEAAGARVTEMAARHHDEVLAATSHLPHVLAFGLVHTLAQLDDRQEVFDYAAGGFRDFTRIAASDPVMWRDICLANGDALLAMMERFGKDLERIEQAIREGDGDFLLRLFQSAQAARLRYGEKNLDGNES